MLANLVLFTISLYLLIGLLFSIPFGVRGVNTLDPVAKPSRWPFRLLIAPGVIALWPILALKWRRAARRQTTP